jgi:hypothetical protein
MNRRRGVGRRGMVPLSASMPKGSAPHGEEHITEHEHLAVADVVGMMIFFRRMPEVLINRLDLDEGIDYVPNEGFQRPLSVRNSIHIELKKVKFPKFWVAIDGLVTEAWLENMDM